MWKYRKVTWHICKRQRCLAHTHTLLLLFQALSRVSFIYIYKYLCVMSKSQKFTQFFQDIDSTHRQEWNLKWTGLEIVVFLHYLSTRSALHSLPHLPKDFFWCQSAFLLNIYTPMNALEGSLGYLLEDTLAWTFSLVDDLVYFLSNSHPSMFVSKTKILGRISNPLFLQYLPEISGKIQQISSVVFAVFSLNDLTFCPWGGINFLKLDI